MESVKLKCPNCGNYINGHLNRSFLNKAARKGTGMAVGAAIGSFVPGVGTAIGAGVGAVVGKLVGSFFTDGVCDVIEEASDPKYDFSCGKCGSNYSYTKSEAEEITRREEAKIIPTSLRSSLMGKILYFLLFVLVSVGMYFVCFHSFKESDDSISTIGWLVYGFTLLLGIILAIWDYAVEKWSYIIFHLLALTAFWMLEKGIILFLTTETFGANNWPTADGWWSFGLSVIGGVLSIFAVWGEFESVFDE